MEKVAGSGRKLGQIDKRTIQAQLGIKTAQQILTDGGGHPLATSQKFHSFMEGMIAKRLERFKHDVANLPLDEWIAIYDACAKLARSCQHAAEFITAKKKRIEYAGDPPAITQVNVENKLQFVVAIDPSQKARIIEQPPREQPGHDHSARSGDPGGNGARGDTAGNGHAYDDD